VLAFAVLVRYFAYEKVVVGMWDNCRKNYTLNKADKLQIVWECEVRVSCSRGKRCGR